MPRSDFVRRHEAALCNEIDIDCKNKWSWTWLDKKVEGLTLGTCFRKLKEAGKAYCYLCRVEVRYNSGGLRALTDHLKQLKNFKKWI